MSTATLGLASNSSVVASTYKWFVERVGCNIETTRPLFLPASVTGSSNMIRQCEMPPSSRYDVKIPAKAPVSTRSRWKAPSLELTRHRPAWRASFGRTPCSTNFAKLVEHGVRPKDALQAGLCRVSSSEGAFHLDRVDTGAFAGILTSYRLDGGIFHCRIMFDEPGTLAGKKKGRLVLILQPTRSTNHF